MNAAMMPMMMVSQIGIACLPGTTRRPSAPMMSPTMIAEMIPVMAMFLPPTCDSVEHRDTRPSCGSRLRRFRSCLLSMIDVRGEPDDNLVDAAQQAGDGQRIRSPLGVPHACRMLLGRVVSSLG